MRILFAPGAYFPALGGTERLTRMLAESLAQRGHFVAVAVADISSFAGYYDLVSPPTCRPALENINGVEIHRIELYSRLLSRQASLVGRMRVWPKGANFAMKVLRYFSRSGYRRRLGTLVDRLKPDVILTLPHLQPNVRIAGSIAKQKGIYLGVFPVIHSSDPFFPHRGMAKFCKKSNVCIPITEVEQKVLIEEYGVPAEKVLFSGIGTTLPAAVNNEARSPVLPDVLFVGRKTASKGLSIFADAVKAIADQIEFRVVLVGARATDTDILEAKFRDELGPGRFVSEDNVSDDELSLWYSRSRLVVLPSKIESFGTVILEAWAHERPIVTLDLPVFRETVTPGVEGLLVPPDDVPALSMAILRLLTNQTEADRMGAAGRVKVAGSYTWSKVTDRIEAHLRSALRT